MLSVNNSSNKQDHLHYKEVNQEIEMMQTAIEIKAEIHRLAEQLSEEATWDDVVREVIFRQAVQEGIDDADAGRVIDHVMLKQKWENKLATALDK